MKLEKTESAIGTDVVTIRSAPNVTFRNYVTERPTPMKKLSAAEAVLEAIVVVPYSVRTVWPIFIDFNLWMNRFGYVWQGVPGENENNYVYISNSGASNELKYGAEGTHNTYVVRKVVKEQLIYFDSLPYKLLDKDSMFTGHNLMSMKEDDGCTVISVFMEHTWYSETMSAEELRKEARKMMFGDALNFWRDYFIPDFMAAVEKNSNHTS